MDENQEFNLGPRFSEWAKRVLQERGASPFEAHRLAKLPAAARLVCLLWMEGTDIPTRQLLTESEENVEIMERRRRKH